jgi:hypothetical protein
MLPPDQAARRVRWHAAVAPPPAARPETADMSCCRFPAARRAAALALTVATLATAPANASAGEAQAAAPAGCVIVFGQGRNVSEDDAAADNLWDGLNMAFNAQVAFTLQSAGERVLPVVLRVKATDLAANVQQLLGRAAGDGCRRIVETTVFADYASRTLVARIRDYPVETEAGSDAGATPRLHIGPPGYVNERQFELTQSTLDRVRPGVLAAEMAREMLDKARR